MIKRLKEDPAVWMFLSGLYCFIMLFYGLYLTREIRFWMLYGLCMLFVIWVFHNQAKRYELDRKGLYRIYRRCAGFALAWPAGWMLLIIAGSLI